MQEVISVLRVRNVFNMCVDFLGKSLALNLLVYGRDNSVLGTILWVCYGNSVGRASLSSAPSLSVCNVTFLVDPCGPGTALFSKRPRERTACASSVSFFLPFLRITGRPNLLERFVFSDSVTATGHSKRTSIHIFWL